MTSSWKWWRSAIAAQSLKSSGRKRRRRAVGSIPSIESLEQRLVLTSAEEQLFVYLLNQIRHDPQAYDAEAGLGGILASVEPRQPLAVNDSLFASAEFHAVEMADNDYFAHQSEVTGDWPNQMAVDAGYVLPNYFALNANYIESLAAGNLEDTPAEVIELLIIDDGVPGFGHRKHLLGIDSFNAQAREIGVGHGFNLNSQYDHYWAAHITFSDPDDTFLTGVVYADGNQDNEFSLNEGLAGVTVMLSGLGMQTTTNAAGGWSIKVPGPGTYTVTASGGTYTGVSSSTVEVDDLNREVDFISGVSQGVVDFGAPTLDANEPPVNTVPAGPLDFAEDFSLPITGVSIADVDAGVADISVTLTVGHGELHISTSVTNGLRSSDIVGNNTDHVVITAPLSEINATFGNAAGLAYQGDLNFNGTDTLTIFTSDLGHTGTGGALTDTDTIELTIAAANDAPRNSVPSGTQSVVTETTMNVAGLSLSDVDLGTGLAIVTLAVQHGTISVRTDVVGGLTAGDIVGNGTNTVTITAPLSLLLPTYQATGGVTYVSDVAYIGADTITVTSSDQGQSGSGGTLTDVDTIAIQVQPIPIAPTLNIPGSTVASSRGLPVIVGVGGTIADPDSPTFSTGKLTVQIQTGAQGTDQLTINKVGVKPGQVNLKKSDVRLGKTVIGRLSGGVGGAPLVITFNSNATLSAVQTVLQNVTLQASKKKLLAGTRTIQFVVTDPTNLPSAPQTRDANVTL